MPGEALAGAGGSPLFGPAVFMGWMPQPPTMTYRPPPVTDEATARAYRIATKPKPQGAPYLVGAALMHLLSIPVGLVLLKALVESAAHRSVSWGEIANALISTGFMGIFLAGILGQVVFVMFAIVGAVLAHSDLRSVGIPMAIIGAIGVAFSFLYFGGITGAIGGGLSIAGGLKARSHPPPVPAYAYPPPYMGSPPGPPP